MIPNLNKLALLASLAAFLSACGGGNDEGTTEPQTYLIKFPHVTAPATPKGQAADRFKELVDERLGGRVAVEVYPSGQLMSDDDSMDALAFGEVQMIAVSLSKLDRLTTKFQVFDLPFLFPGIEQVEQFQKGPAGQALLDELTDRGFKGVAFWHNGMKQFGGPVAFDNPSNADGLKFRIMESDVLEAQIRQMNGNPQKMAFGEVYQALQTGAVDAQENTWSNRYSSQFYEVQDYLTETNHGYLGYLVAVNTGFWNGLPEDIQTELHAIIKEVEAWANARSNEINMEHRGKVAESGKSEIVTLTADQQVQWQQSMKPVWDEFRENIGADLIQAALDSSN
jgi:C4-dicarboxylate-binding protein DctP